MRDGWELMRLGDLCHVIGGGTPSKAKAEYYSGEIPWATVRDIKSEFLTATEYKITKEAVESSSTNIIPKGNIVIATRVGLGKVCILGQDTAINQDLRGLLPINPKFLSIRFIYRWLQLTSDLIIAEGTGATVQGVKLPFIKSLKVPLPPLTEQHRIVAILDEAFEGIAAAKDRAERNLKNARELFESYLNDVFSRRGEGWEEMRLGDVLATGAGGTPLKSKKEYYEGGDIPWLMSGEVNQGEILTATKFITRKGYENSSARMFPKNTVLIAMYGATAGAVGILRIESTTNQAVCGIFPNDNFVPEFLFYVLLAKKQELIDQATGNAQPNISQIKVKNTKVPIIPIAEQINIVATVSELSFDIQRLESIYRQKLAALDELKQSLLHQAFTGEL